MLYNAPSGSTDPNASYVGKDVASSRQGSKLPPTVPEGVQREIVAIIAAAQAMGLEAPTNADLKQMLKAIRSGLLHRFPATGTPDAIAIAPVPAYVALVEGMRFRMKVPGSAGSSNTSTTPTLGVNSLSAPIKLRDGSAPAGGALVAGLTAEFEIDASLNARLIGITTADTTSVLDSRNIVGGNVVFFPNPGSFTFTVPPGITRIRAKVWGGGGGGGSAGGNGSGAGGNGGGYSEGVFTVTPGQVLPITVGAGGVAYTGTTGQAGSTGGTSSVGSLISATGGGGGGGSATAGAINGLYGLASAVLGNGVGGQINISSSRAANAYGSPVAGSGGSGAFGTSGTGMSYTGGIGAQFPAGGGGGAAIGFGGALGAGGLVIIES